MSATTDHNPNETEAVLKVALARIHASAEERHGHITYGRVATALEVAKSAVSGWMSGHTIPREKNLEALAEFYSFGDERLAARYRSELFAAARKVFPEIGRKTPRVITATVSAPARNRVARARDRELIRIGIAKYTSFARFYQDALAAFADYSGLLKEVTDQLPFENFTQDVKDGPFDIGAPYLATPDRALHLHFILTAPRVSVNAITFSSAYHLKRPLSIKKTNANPVIRPILAEREVGDLYCRYRLGFDRSYTDQSAFGAETYARKLVERFQEWLSFPEQERERRPVPVIFADEFTCLEIQIELLKWLILRGPPSGAEPGSSDRYSLITPERAGVPLILLGRHKETIHPDHIEYNPHYNLAICVDREDTGWTKYVDEAWHIFLRSNPDFLAKEYAAIYVSLKDKGEELKRLLDGHADLIDYQKEENRLLSVGHPMLPVRGQNSNAAVTEEWNKQFRKWLGFPPLPREENEKPWTLHDPEGIWNYIIEQARQLSDNEQSTGTGGSKANSQATDRSRPG